MLFSLNFAHLKRK